MRWSQRLLGHAPTARTSSAEPNTQRRKGFAQAPFWSLSDHVGQIGGLGSVGVLPDREEIGNNYEAYVREAYKANGIVFACILTRQLVFSEARFLWQRMTDSRPGDLFGTADLALLETPWGGGTTGALLARMELDTSLAGNFYATTVDDSGRHGAGATGPGRRLARLRPDWVTLIIASASDDPYALDAKVVGYLYEPRLSGGQRADSVLLLPSEVAHYAPIPDPDARFRGMSWLTPVLREIDADKAATQHKRRFLQNGATPQVIVSVDTDDEDEFSQFIRRFREEHRGPDKAGETLFLAGGADATVVGANLRDLDFKGTQGAGETRIAAAAGVPPVIAGFSEGLQAATYSNYGQARRRFADGTMRPLWRMAAAALQTVLSVPRAARLWYDDRDIPFLREDRKDVAEIQWRQAATVRQLVDAGFEPATVVSSVQAEDFSLLTHTGLFSVQLQPPGTGQAAGAPDPPLPGTEQE